MNEIIEKENVIIENMIYEVRGKQVMLDSDLAKLYNCKNGTKVINQAVNRNIERFPEDFYFQLTKDEYNKILRSQFVTLEIKQGKDLGTKCFAISKIEDKEILEKILKYINN